MSVTSYLQSKGFYNLEGYSQQEPKQVYDLISIIANKPNLNIMEIGFNGGHSAEIFLEYNADSKVTSFDIGWHDYIHVAKEYIDAAYPDRHTLILGDSRVTVPTFCDANNDTKFDVIFIDGGHDYDIARADMGNCIKLAHKDTIVILDDTYFSENYTFGGTIGPTRTWLENLAENKVVEIKRKEYAPHRGMSWGKYVV